MRNINEMFILIREGQTKYFYCHKHVLATNLSPAVTRSFKQFVSKFCSKVSRQSEIYNKKLSMAGTLYILRFSLILLRIK